MNYYISDMHWGQEDVIEYDDRPFVNALECYKYMREKWNQIVTSEDHVYIVGDCVCRNADDICSYLQGLNGHLHLVVGNHDDFIIKNPAMIEYFEEIAEIINTIDDEGRIIVLCHYPIACWEHKNHDNCFHIYGHVHKYGEEEFCFMNKNGNALNAGCMINHYVPVTIENLIENNKKHYQSTEIDWR